MRSSPTRTFSPSDLCLEAGCIVHQQASPTGQGSQDDGYPEYSSQGLLFLSLPCLLPTPTAATNSASQSPIPALRPSAYSSPVLAQVFPSRCVHSHPQSIPMPAPMVLQTSLSHPALQLLHLLHPPAVPRQRPACQSWSGRW